MTDQKPDLGQSGWINGNFLLQQIRRQLIECVNEHQDNSEKITTNWSHPHIQQQTEWNFH